MAFVTQKTVLFVPLLVCMYIVLSSPKKHGITLFLAMMFFLRSIDTATYLGGER